ncbi:MAG: DUF427 domain-containing protein [Gammaproteobacteria bacterium]|nr:DUF427 domain-containing protein [Gammaproteobacteria bacterium]TVQ47224.1 MAG: DUF427 domain-containing protein [Gammaproteobacteria bacterium]
MKAIWHDAIIAESDDTLVIEGNHYFPRYSLRRHFLKDSPTTSFCPWKGTAHYYHVAVNGAVNEDAAWYYPEPLSAAGEIRGRVAFWKGIRIVE